MAENTPKEKKIDPVGLSIYGEGFLRYHRIAELNDLIPAFKDFYYEEKVKDPNCNFSQIIRGFNEQVCAPVGRTFFPSMSQARVWRKKWDLDLMQQMTGKELEIVERKNVHQMIKTRDAKRELILGVDDNELEAGVRTLGGELVNDAAQMLRDDQELDEIYDTDELIRRRNYIVNVFAHVTRLVHGKAALLLKASEEKRNTAGFLMKLLARATAGQMSDEEMNLLENAYAPKESEQAQQSA